MTQKYTKLQYLVMTKKNMRLTHAEKIKEKCKNEIKEENKQR